MKVLDSVSAILKEKGSEVWSIGPDATVYESLELMASKSVGALLVMEEDRVLGMLSERDYARRIVLHGRSSKATRVSEIMSAPAITITTDATVDDAMRLMTEKHVRHLPIMGEDGGVVGVVSVGDLVKWTISSHEKTIEQLESYISGQVSTTGAA